MDTPALKSIVIHRLSLCFDVGNACQLVDSLRQDRLLDGLSPVVRIQLAIP